MPKRKHEETKEERWERKMKKYEGKLQEKRHRSYPRRRQRVIYSSDEEVIESDVQQKEHLERNDNPIAPAPPTERPSEVHEAEERTESSTPPAPMPAPPSPPPPVAEDPVIEEPDVDSSPSDEYDVTLLQSLGEAETETTEFGDNIHSEIASRLHTVLISGLKKESRDGLLKKFLIPQNLENLKAPTLNPEIEAMLVETCRLRDKRLLTKQDQLGRILSALTITMTELLKKNPNITEVLRTLNDAAKLLADSHYAETDTRRAVILPLIDKSLTDTFKNRKRDSLLFGKSLGESVKTSQGIKRTSQVIQAPKNFKGPSASTRVRQWPGQAYPQPRAGGQRASTTSYGNRRRTGPPPASSHHPPYPPPAPQRRPPLPAPPARRQTQSSTHRPPFDRHR